MCGGLRARGKRKSIVRDATDVVLRASGSGNATGRERKCGTTHLSRLATACRDPRMRESRAQQFRGCIAHMPQARSLPVNRCGLSRANLSCRNRLCSERHMGIHFAVLLDNFLFGLYYLRSWVLPSLPVGHTLRPLAPPRGVRSSAAACRYRTTSTSIAGRRNAERREIRTTETSPINVKRVKAARQLVWARGAPLESKKITELRRGEVLVVVEEAVTEEGEHRARVARTRARVASPSIRLAG